MAKCSFCTKGFRSFDSHEVLFDQKWVTTLRIKQILVSISQHLCRDNTAKKIFSDVYC